MDTQKILRYIDILRAMQDSPITISDIAANYSPSRSTIRRFIQEDAEEWGLIRRSSGDYTLTAAGNLLLREYDNIDDEKQTGLSYLAKSQHGLDLLRVTNSQPDDRATVTRKSDASRSTVQRHLDDFQESEWINEQNKYIGLRSDGREIIESYETFRRKIGIIEDKIEFLERLEDVEELPPIEALAESRIVVSTITDRREVVREVNKLEPDGAESVYGLSSAFSQEISEEFESKVPLNTECELIVDRSVYTAITNPKRWKYLFRGLRRPNFRLLILPKNIAIGIGLFGDEQAVISAYNAEIPFDAALIGENEKLIEWGKEIYAHYQAQASPPTTDLMNAHPDTL